MSVLNNGKQERKKKVMTMVTKADCENWRLGRESRSKGMGELVRKAFPRLFWLLVLMMAGWSVQGCDKEEQTCPDRIDEVACGQCSVDAVSGASSKANVCVYCPAGTTCPQDPCHQSCVTPDCSQFPVPCGQVENGVEVTGGLVPLACGCPDGTLDVGRDDSTEGGPYLECRCL